MISLSNLLTLDELHMNDALLKYPEITIPMKNLTSCLIAKEANMLNINDIDKLDDFLKISNVINFKNEVLKAEESVSIPSPEEQTRFYNVLERLKEIVDKIKNVYKKVIEYNLSQGSTLFNEADDDKDEWFTTYLITEFREKMDKITNFISRISGEDSAKEIKKYLDKFIYDELILHETLNPSVRLKSNINSFRGLGFSFRSTKNPEWGGRSGSDMLDLLIGPAVPGVGSYYEDVGELGRTLKELNTFFPRE